MSERRPLPRKVPTRIDPYPIPGSCNEVSARGRHCWLRAGHEPPHRAINRTTFVTVIAYDRVDLRRGRK